MKTQYIRHYTINDAKQCVKNLQNSGFKAYYQTINSYNYQVRYWK